MNKKFNPKVSIVIPVYNGSNFLEQAIISALQQTYKNIEILVINDGSNDDGKTEEIAKKYKEKIKYFYKENGGVSTALNMAIEKMSGDYFSWLSHDDLYYENKIEKQIKFIEENNLQNKRVILFGDYSVIDENGKVFAECKKNHEELENKPEYALLRGHLNGITMLIPKKAFNDYGNFDESLKCTQDYDMWKKMMKTYKFIHQTELLAKTRIHGKRDTAVNPKVISEGNKLWINLIENVSQKRKAELEGSEYTYYEKMINFLEETPYNEAKKHCENKIQNIEENVEKKLKYTKVSIVIPFYNGQDLTIRTIKSAQEQTYKNIEILVINDGSKEDTTKLESYISQDSRIKYIKSDKNYGTGYSRNLGIKKSAGEYIALLDSDDLFINTKIEKQVRAMLLHEGIFSYTSYIKRDEENKENIMTIEKTNGKLFPDIIGQCTIATPTVMLKKSFIEENNIYYPENSSIGEDVCFYIKALEDINIVGIKEPLSIVNVNKSSAAYDYKKQLEGLKRIIAFVLNNEKTRKYDFEIFRLFKQYIYIFNFYNPQEDELEKYAKEIEAYRNEIKNYSNEMEMLYKKNVEYDAKCYNLEQEVNTLQIYVANVEKSLSWKITSPLRKLSSLMRKILKKTKILK